MIHFTRYMQIAYRLTLSLLCCTFLYSCSDRAALESVEQVLATAEEHPAEALEQIRSIDPNKLHGEHNRARYALAYSEALYYNRIDSDCDTLVGPMMRYYIHHDNNHSERARALYQYALVKYNNRKFPEALFAIEEAHKSLDISEDYKLRGLLCRYEGYMYQTEYMFYNSYKAHIKGYEYFGKAGLSLYMGYALMHAGTAMARTVDYNDAVSILEQAYDLAIANNNKHLLCHVVYEQCRIHIQNGEYDKCEATISILNTHDCALYYQSDFNCIRAMIAASKNNIKLAQQYLKKAENNITPNDELLDYAKYVVAFLSKDNATAMELYNIMVKEQNRVVHSSLKASILNDQINYLRENIKQEQREKRLLCQRNIVIYTIIFLIFIAVYIYVIYRIKAQNNRVINYIETIGQLQENYDHLSSKLHNEVVTIYGDYFNDLNALCEIKHTYSASSRESAKIFEKVNNIIKDMRKDSSRMQKLEQIVNLHNEDIIMRLRETTSLHDKELRFILYTIVGFSTQSIAMLLEIETASVWRLKYNIKKKLSAINGIDIDKIFGKR